MRITRTIRTLGLVAVALLAISCGTDRSPTAPPTAAPQADLLGGTLGTVNNLVGTLLTCRPLPFASDSELVGPAGGVVQMGPHALVIPPLALTHPVWIKGEAPSDTVNSVRFSPEGLTFNRPAALVMSYANCNLVAGLLTPKRIAYTTDDLHVISWQPSWDNLFGRTVTGRIDHFSRYAIGW